MRRMIAQLVLAAGLLGSPTSMAATVLFDFDNAPLHSSLPISLTVDGLTALFSSNGPQNGFSVQEANVLGFTPSGFSGQCLYPNSINKSDLTVDFSQTVYDFSIMYAPEEYATDSSATMRVTAYMGGNFVGTNTTNASPGTWPTGILTFHSSLGFNEAVVHYDSPPVTGGDYGPIFMADNMEVSTAVPEPCTPMLLGLGVLGALIFRARGIGWVSDRSLRATGLPSS